MMEEVNRIISFLKKKGYGISMPRIAIINYLVSNKSHHTAESIYKAISKKYPSISIATIYNTLKLLSREGFVNQLFIEGEKVFYDSTPESHSHFICRTCGKIKDLQYKPEEVKKLKGDRVEKIYVYFYGVCEDCAKKEKKS
jgi:Fur family peroxide stress response transcriptional regulator